MTRVAALIVALAAPAPAWAQPRVWETVIVTAHHSPVRFEHLSRAVTVVTREQIARLPVRSLADALRLVANVDVRARGPLGVQTDFVIRGAGFGQALVLVDGVRLNDAQSGHHNGDIPVRLEDIERIEVLSGAGSSVHGADAFGGVVNIVTRTPDRGSDLALTGGAFGLVEASAGVAFGADARRHSVGVSASRADGFAYDRDFQTIQARTRVAVNAKTTISIAHLDKNFGANGFYGPAPSKEWTTQSLVVVDRVVRSEGPWKATAALSYRTHGDRFLYDLRQPGAFENRTRTHAALARLKASRGWSGGTALTAGVETGGDWIRSSNLGGHALGRGSLFAELQRPLGSRVVLNPGLRVDAYSDYGVAWSPTLSASAFVNPAVKLRASLGRAFRVPTYTERYYSDPNHQATAALGPERSWSADAGVDWLYSSAWVLTATAFARSERDVIDWVRQSPRDRWRTTNIRKLGTQGVELGARRLFADGAFLDVQYAWLDSHADELNLLSKYVLDFARHNWTVSGSAALPGELMLGSRFGHTRRVDGRRFSTLDVRVSRRLGPVEMYLEAGNLLNERYQETRGVDMPPRWLRGGLRLE